MNLMRFNGAVEPGARAVSFGEHRIETPQLREGASGELVLGVRPEQIRFDDAASFRGRILAAEYLGTTQIITLETAFGDVKARVSATESAPIGQNVGIAMNSGTLSLFRGDDGGALRTSLNEGAF